MPQWVPWKQNWFRNCFFVFLIDLIGCSHTWEHLHLEYRFLDGWMVGWLAYLVGEWVIGWVVCRLPNWATSSGLYIERHVRPTNIAQIIAQYTHKSFLKIHILWGSICVVFFFLRITFEMFHNCIQMIF